MPPKYIVNVITSKFCIKCAIYKQTRSIYDTLDGDGKIERKIEFYKGRSFNEEFYRSLLLPSEELQAGDVLVQDIVFSTSNGIRDELSELVIYSLDDDKRVQGVSYTKSDKGTVANAFGPNGYSKRTDTRVEFAKIINKHVPYRIHNFTFLFPGFTFARADEWNKAIDNENYFFKALSAGCVHGDYPGGTWTVNKSKDVDSKTYMMDPLAVLVDIVNGKIDLNVKPDDPPPRSGEDEEDDSDDETAKGYIDYDTIRGKIRSNDGDVPFSNGLHYSYVPDDYFYQK